MIIEGKASWYGAENEKLNYSTALNLPFHSELIEGAIAERYKKDIPLGSVVRVSSLSKNLVLRITDFGIPENREDLKDRIIDLTVNAFYFFAPLELGLVEVKVELLKLPEKYNKKENENER